MSKHVNCSNNSNQTRQAASTALGPTLTRRSLLGTGLLMGLATLGMPAKQAYAWSSWTNVTSSLLKDVGMGDCVHEDLVQISYARMLRDHLNDTTTSSLLNPWAGVLSADKMLATIAGDTVERGAGKAFADEADLATRLYRENLAYLRIGSFWNDAAANMLADFCLSCYYANSIPKYSGNDYYTGAWEVGQHIWETYQEHPYLDAVVQFTMNDRNNFIHGMLSSTASHSKFLKQSEVKQFALQWLGVTYEYARTGKVSATSDVTQDQAEQIFKGFIDTYDQLIKDETDQKAHEMCVSLKVGSQEASRKLPHRRLRLRALGMMCHTLEDLWCPAHTCRTYCEGGSVQKNSILAFNNYKLQNGNKPPILGYHIPFDRYARSDKNNATNWREALTRGDAAHKGTETLANLQDPGMSCLAGANTYFNTLGMNETIACITKLFEFLYQDTAWDSGVRTWVDTEIMPTYFDGDGQSYVCDGGRRCLHTPTYIIAPIKAMKRAYGKLGLSDNYNEVLAAAKSYDNWQRGAHEFYSGADNTSQAKLWNDETGESCLVELADKLHAGYQSLGSSEQADLLARIGSTGCHGMVNAINMIRGMLQEFNIDLRGSLRSDVDETMQKLDETRKFFESGLTEQGGKGVPLVASALGLFGVGVAYAEEEDSDYITSSMALEIVEGFDDGSYVVAARDMDSLNTVIMDVPAGTPGIERLEEGVANLTITYELEREFEDDTDYCYTVTNIDYPPTEEDVYFITGTVVSVAKNKQSLILDFAGDETCEFAIAAGLLDVPQAGRYICAMYVYTEPGVTFVGYEELDDPGDVKTVAYPVADVFGSSLLLLANGSVADAKKDYVPMEGDAEETPSYRDYLQIEYGSAEFYDMPHVGEEITIRYRDEIYDDANGLVALGEMLPNTGDEPIAASDDEPLAVVDETEIGGANDGIVTIDSESASANEGQEDAEDELTDSAEPEYLAMEDYGELSYGDGVYHVATTIGLPSIKTAKTSPEPTVATKTPTQSAANTATRKTNVPLAHTGDALMSTSGVLSGAAVASAALVAHSSLRRTNGQGSDKEE